MASLAEAQDVAAAARHFDNYLVRSGIVWASVI